ncbi:hypothetical protein ACHWQZ_G017386 [Mnemiopsis leidyi]
MDPFSVCHTTITAGKLKHVYKRFIMRAVTIAWRCRKNNPPTKCPCHAYLTLTDNSLTLGSKPHNHPADNAAPLKREVLSTLKRKAAEQPLSVTQNILSEVLADSTPETNQTLPTMESLASPSGEDSFQKKEDFS